MPGLAYRACDLGSTEAVAGLFAELRPEVALNLASMTEVDACEKVTRAAAKRAAPRTTNTVNRRRRTIRGMTFLRWIAFVLLALAVLPVGSAFTARNTGEGASAISGYRVSQLRFVAAASRAEKLLAQLPAAADNDALKGLTRRLIAFGSSADNIFNLRREELRQIAVA